MAIVSKMTRCAACGSTAVTYSEGTKLYHCADCGAERPDSMPAADLSAVNSILALGDTEGKLLCKRAPRTAGRKARTKNIPFVHGFFGLA